MRRWCILILFHLCGQCFAAPEHSSQQKVSQEDWVYLPETEYFEIVHSRIENALMRDLATTPFRELRKDEAKAYCGSLYRCPPNKKPILVKASYRNGGTGGFYVRRNGNNLWIVHSSLGEGGVEQFSALVINVDFQVESIRSSTASAR